MRDVSAADRIPDLWFSVEDYYDLICKQKNMSHSIHWKSVFANTSSLLSFMVFFWKLLLVARRHRSEPLDKIPECVSLALMQWDLVTPTTLGFSYGQARRTVGTTKATVQATVQSSWRMAVCYVLDVPKCPESY